MKNQMEVQKNYSNLNSGESYRAYLNEVLARRGRGRYSSVVTTYWKKKRRQYSVAKSIAKKAGRAWELTLTQYTNLTSKPCFYCKQELNKTGIRLDRKNSDLNYSLENVVPCCWSCNNLKGSRFTLEETQVMVNALKKYRKTLLPKGD